MPGIPIRLDGITAKIETTYGTDPTPAAATDGVRISERIFSSLRLGYAWENNREDVATGTILPAIPGISRGRMATIDIAWEIRGAGSDVVPEVDPLLRACGMAQTDGALLFSYAQASNLHESCTIWCYAGGTVYKIVGCRGSWRWPIQPGRHGVLRFTMMGIMTTDPAALAVPAITYDATEPPTAVDLALTVASWTPEVYQAEFNQGVQPQMLESANAADGIREFDFGEARPFLAMSARLPRDATGILDTSTYNPYADAKARTARAIVATLGSVQYNRMKVNSVNGYVQMPAHADNNRFAAWDLRYEIPAGIVLQFD